MATSLDYAQFVCEQLHGPWQVRYKKMFGEYMIYVNDKPVLLVCDNTVYVKKLDQLTDLMDNTHVGTPYKGAKEHYILDIEDTDLVESVIDILERNTLVPSKKAKEKTMEYFCQSCGMPMKKKEDFGTNKDGSQNLDYCTYCFQKGKFTISCSMDEMIEHNLKFLDEFNKDAKTTFDESEARKTMQSFFPTLKRWKK